MAANPNISEFIGISPRSEFDLAEIVERGLPLSSIDTLKEKGLTFSEVAELVISPRTLNIARRAARIFPTKRPTGWCGSLASSRLPRIPSAIHRKHSCGYAPLTIALGPKPT